MSENIFIQRRKRARNRPFLTLRVIFSLIFLSLLMAGGVYFEFGGTVDRLCEGGCESRFDIHTWLLGIMLLVGGVIGLALAAGILVALVRRSRRNNDTLAALLNQKEDTE